MSNSFKMVVSNDSGDTLNNVLLTHYCDNNVSSIYLGTLGSYTTSSAVSCGTYSGHNDYYLFQFIRNNVVFQANTYCNWSSPATDVMVQLQPSKYNIGYNGGVSGCNSKAYNYST